METVENKNPNRGQGRVWAALILIAIGSALVLERMGLGLPGWLFTWPMILILIGLFIGFKHGFRGPAWIIMILIGGFFLFDDFMPDFSLHRFVWPLVIIFVGIAILLRPRRHPEWDKMKEEWKNKNMGKDWKENWKSRERKYGNYSSEDFIDATTVFGGVHKSIVSKDFKGGGYYHFHGRVRNQPGAGRYYRNSSNRHYPDHGRYKTHSPSSLGSQVKYYVSVWQCGRQAAAG